MKVFCEGLDLADAVLKVSRAAGSKVTGGNLDVIKIAATGDSLVLTATDTELTLEKTIKANVSLDGEFLISTKIFPDFIKKLTKNQIEMVLLNDNELKIRYDENESIFQVFQTTGFPQVAEVSENNSFVMIQTELKQIIEKTAFCAATEDSNPLLKSVYFAIEESLVSAVAIDGQRLALCKKPVKKAIKPCNVIVPSKTIKEIYALLEDKNEDITVYVENKFIKIKSDNLILVSRLIEGEYIKYRGMIKDNLPISILVNRKKFLESLERIDILNSSASALGRSVVKLEIKEKQINLISSSDITSARETIVCEMAGKDTVIAFNCRYLIEALKNISSETVKIYLETPTAPAVFTPGAQEELLYLILPMRI